MDYKIETTFPKFQRDYNHSVKSMPDHLRSTLRKNLNKMRKEMKENVTGGMVKKRTGLLGKEIRTKTSVAGGIISGAVGLLYNGNQGKAFYGLFFEKISSTVYTRRKPKSKKTGKRASGKFTVRHIARLKPWHTSVVDKHEGKVMSDFKNLAGEIFG